MRTFYIVLMVIFVAGSAFAQAPAKLDPKALAADTARYKSLRDASHAKWQADEAKRPHKLPPGVGGQKKK